MFWTGFATALLLVAALHLLRWLWALRAWSAPEEDPTQQARQLFECGQVLQAAGVESAAIPLWLHLATHYPQQALLAEFRLSELLLSDYPTDEAWVTAYQALAQAYPTDTGIAYKLGKALQKVGRFDEARAQGSRVYEPNAQGWRYRVEEDLAATDPGRLAV